MSRGLRFHLEVCQRIPHDFPKGIAREGCQPSDSETDRKEPSNRVEVVVTTTFGYHGGRAGRVHLSSHMRQLGSPLILATTAVFSRNSQFLDDPCPPKKSVCSGSILEGSK